MLPNTAFRASWILTGDGNAIPDGLVTVHQGSIEYVGPFPQGDPYRKGAEEIRGDGELVDLGHVALIPGLVNAHTHLEFSDLATPLGKPGIPFTEWIAEVVRYRASRSAESTDAQSVKRNAIALGVAESVAAGVVAIGEIASYPFMTDAYPELLSAAGSPPCVATIFLEQLGRNAHQIQSKLSELETGLSKVLTASGASSGAASGATIGLSPHAPYSVHPKLLTAMVNLAQSKQLPIAIHLAETQEEVRLLKHADGPFVELMKKLNVWFPDSYQAGDSIIRWLQELNDVSRLLIIHGNYLSAADIEFCATRKSQLSVVFCPRTSDYFGHKDYPLRRILSQGINVAVGTDSRASNPDLNLFTDLQWIHRHFPNIDSETILKMGTVNGAKALGLSDSLGSISVGKQALMNVVNLPQPQVDNPFAEIFSDRAECVPLERWLLQNQAQ